MEGCSWWQVLFRVLLPMSWLSVLAFATVSITTTGTSTCGR